MKQILFLAIPILLISNVCQAKPDKKRDSIADLGDKYDISLNGSKVKYNQSLFSGQKVNIALNRTTGSLPANSTLTWGIDGVIVSEYNPSYSKSNYSAVPSAGPSQTEEARYVPDTEVKNGQTVFSNNINFFWVNGNVQGQAQNVRAYLSQNGIEKKKTVFFKLKRPGSSISAPDFKFGDVKRGYLSDSNTSPAIGLTSRPADAKGFAAGIVIDGSSYMPWSQGATSSGALAFVQVLNTTGVASMQDGSTRKNPQNGLTCADGAGDWHYASRAVGNNDTMSEEDLIWKDNDGDNYIKIRMFDGPNQTLSIPEYRGTDGHIKGPFADHLTVSTQFYTYLMYIPPVASGRWIPLRQVNWDWTGQMKYQETNNGYLVPNTGYRHKTVATWEVFDHPKWTAHAETELFWPTVTP